MSESDKIKTRSHSSRDLPEMLTAKDLEELLKIDLKTIYSYVQRGLIPYVRIQSNVRFIKHQIFEWVEAQNYRPKNTDRMGPSNGGKL